MNPSSLFNAILLLSSAILSASSTATGMKWTESDIEAWEEFGRWRRNHPIRRRSDLINRERESDRDRERNWDNDRNRRLRNDEDDNRGRLRDPVDWNQRKRKNDKDNMDNDKYVDKDKNKGMDIDKDKDKDKNYNYNNDNDNDKNDKNDKSYIDNDGKQRKLPPIFIPPSIIEPYPVEQTSLYPSYSSEITTSYHQTTPPAYQPSSSTSYHPSSTSVSPTVKKQNYSYPSNNSTVVVTVPESTATAKITGRYRAMSNSADNLVAGTISYLAALLGSLFMIILI